MKRTLQWIAVLLTALVVTAGALLLHTWYAKPLSINWFYTRAFLRLALDNPELLTSLRLLEPLGIRGHNAKLTDASLARADATFALFRDELATLKRYDASVLTGQDRISYDIFAYYVTDQVAHERWRFHDFPVNQGAGVQVELPNLMTQQQQINDATDAAHFIARLNAYPRKFDQVIEGLKLRESKGMLPPKFTVDKVLDQIQKFSAPGAAGNVLSASFREKLAKLPADRLDADTRNALTTRAEKAVADSVLPAYEALRVYFESLRSKAIHNHGAWAQPDGAAYYQHRIESNTTTTMTAPQIHALGLREVERVGREMDAILTAAGYTQGSRAQKIAQLAVSPSQLYPDNDTGRKQILKDFQAIIDEITAGLDPFFKTKPKAAVVVKRMPEFTEAGTSGAYYASPPMDGSAPGTFYANLRDVKEVPRFGMRTLAYHEAVPGHHLQTAIAQELSGLPIFRSLVPFTAYDEGWALYAEHLAWEMGYQKDPINNLGRLRDEMLRAVRLVVDTGIHHERWTRERAIDYMLRETGMSEPEVVTEIERYFLDPGQALAYKVGMLKILELRERAKADLGAKFDIREFHDAVLVNGGMPLAVLERVINEHITARKAM
jgi:uncharacterized protein (DUF885 family)